MVILLKNIELLYATEILFVILRTTNNVIAK